MVERRWAILASAGAGLAGLVVLAQISARKRRGAKAKRKYVLGIGLAALDAVAQVESFPTRDQKHRSKSLSRSVGGNCAISLTAVAALGGNAIFWTALGCDPESAFVLDDLRGRGVDVDQVLCSTTNVTPFSYIIAHGGSRTIIHQPQPEELPAAFVAEEVVAGAAWLHLDTRHNEAGVAAAQVARRHQVPVSLDVERERPRLLELLSLADVIVCSEQYIRTTYGDDLDAGLLQFTASTSAEMVVNTRGSSGSVAVLRPRVQLEVLRQPVTSRMVVGPIDDGSRPARAPAEMWQLLTCPAFPAPEVVDSTGAGDVFVGSLIQMLLEGLTVDCALLAASLVASESVAHLGGRTKMTRAAVAATLGLCLSP